jgi:trigger factor
VRLGLLLSEIGRAANIQVSQAEITTALRQEAGRYPGQEMQVVEYFRKTPGAIEQLRGPLFEDKVVDYILEMAKVEDRIVQPDELALPPADPLSAPQKLEFLPADPPEAETPAEAAVEADAEAVLEPNAEFDAVLAHNEREEAVAAEATPAEPQLAEPPVDESEAHADHAGEAA